MCAITSIRHCCAAPAASEKENVLLTETNCWPRTDAGSAPTPADSRRNPAPAGRRRSRRLPTFAALVAALTGVIVGGSVSTAWAAATTYVSNQASASGYPVGLPIYDSATLGWGVNPTGTITYRLYHPTDPTCIGSPIFSSDTTVTGNGYYESARFVPTIAGTYRWIATYNGDANNNYDHSRCDDQGAAVSVAQRRATLLGSATVTGGGSTTRDTVTLTGANPTGSMQYKLYGPNNMTCAGSPIHGSTRTVSGDGNYTSAAFTATTTGTYRWTVYYSGDANNMAAASTCTDQAHAVNLVAAPVGPSVGATPTTAADGAVLTATWSGITAPTSTDWVALYAVGAPDSAVVAWRYTSGAAGGNVTMTIPWGTFAGAYELRLFSQNSYVRLATSGTITVT